MSDKKFKKYSEGEATLLIGISLILTIGMLYDLSIFIVQLAFAIISVFTFHKLR